MGLDGREITILGGGIGGLAAALALTRRGARVRVLEQAEAISEVGAGIQVSPNGLRVLEGLGLGDGFAAISVRGRAVSMRDGLRATEVTRLDLDHLPEGQRYGFVHRADLIALLARAVRAAGVEIRLLQQVVALQPGAPIRLSFANGDQGRAGFVVGADGLHSVLRPVLNGSARPFFTGQVAWRAVVPNEIGHPDAARLSMGPGRHLVSYPLRGGKVVNLVAVEERRDWVAESWSHRDDPANLRAAFADFGGDVPRLLDAVEAPGLWGLFRHEVAQNWHGENLVLLGDAAHPTLPFMAQGANMALEDAWALAACLDRFGLAEGPAKYQELRRDRVKKVVAAATGNAWKYHLGPPFNRLAQLGLGALGRLAPGRLLGQFDWIYGYDVTRVCP